LEDDAWDDADMEVGSARSIRELSARRRRPRAWRLHNQTPYAEKSEKTVRNMHEANTKLKHN
jgi:hypothetical protein